VCRDATSTRASCAVVNLVGMVAGVNHAETHLFTGHLANLAETILYSDVWFTYIWDGGKYGLVLSAIYGAVWHGL